MPCYYLRCALPHPTPPSCMTEPSSLRALSPGRRSVHAPAESFTSTQHDDPGIPLRNSSYLTDCICIPYLLLFGYLLSFLLWVSCGYYVAASGARLDEYPCSSTIMPHYDNGLCTGTLSYLLTLARCSHTSHHRNRPRIPRRTYFRSRHCLDPSAIDIGGSACNDNPSLDYRLR